MSSTTVHSKNSKSTVSIAGSAFKATEKTLEIPPKSQIFEVIPSYVEEQGNVELYVGESYVNDKNELVKSDGTVISMKSEKAFKKLLEHKNKKDKMQAKTSKSKKEVEVDR